MSAEEVCRRYGFSISTLRRLWYSSDFPAPIRIGRRRIAWQISTLLDWEKQREAHLPETQVNRIVAKPEESYP